jgi:hypothetical protein
LADDLPIDQHVEAFERALNLYRGQQFEQAAELVSACCHIHQYTIMQPGLLRQPFGRKTQTD